MNAEGRMDTLAGLDSINLTDWQRTRVKRAVQQSDLIVSAMLALAHYLGFATRPARQQS